MKTRPPSQQGRRGPAGGARGPAQVAARGRPMGRAGGGTSGGKPKATFRCVGPTMRASACLLYTSDAADDM
eukprot:8080841-Alexandrium_andersonii.AAC.1